MSFAAFGMGALNKLAGNLSDTYGTGHTLRTQQRDEAKADYLANEREGIQARVEGAKAAGLHPLAALGFQAGQGPSTFVSGGPVSPGYVEPRSAPAAKADPTLQRINEANARRAEAEAEMAEINAHNSMRALASQPGNAPAGAAMPTEPQNQIPGMPKGLAIPGVKIKANEIISSINGTEVGHQPGASKVNVPGYGTWTMPSDALNQKLEDAELLKTLAILGLNRGKLYDFVTSDVPWALRGYANDYSERLKKALQYRGKPRRSGGATGSW